MSILGMISQKKRQFNDKLEAYQDKVTLKRTNKLEALTQQRIKQQEKAELKKAIRKEKELIREAKYGQLKKDISGAIATIKKAKKKMPKKKKNPFYKQKESPFSMGNGKNPFQ